MAARVLQFFAGLLERTKSGLRERINMVVEELLQKNLPGRSARQNAVAPRRAEWLQQQRQAGSDAEDRAAGFCKVKSRPTPGTWLSFVHQRLSVAVHKAVAREVSDALGLSAAVDPRGAPRD